MKYLFLGSVAVFLAGAAFYGAVGDPRSALVSAVLAAVALALFLFAKLRP